MTWLDVKISISQECPPPLCGEALKHVEFILTFGLVVGLCYLLFYPLKITPFRDQNHILGHSGIFSLYFWIFPTLTEKVHVGKCFVE